MSEKHGRNSKAARAQRAARRANHAKTFSDLCARYEFACEQWADAVARGKVIQAGMQRRRRMKLFRAIVGWARRDGARLREAREATGGGT